MKQSSVTALCQYYCAKQIVAKCQIVVWDVGHRAKEGKHQLKPESFMIRQAEIRQKYASPPFNKCTKNPQRCWRWKQKGNYVWAAREPAVSCRFVGGQSERYISLQAQLLQERLGKVCWAKQLVRLWSGPACATGRSNMISCCCATGWGGEKAEVMGSWHTETVRWITSSLHVLLSSLKSSHLHSYHRSCHTYESRKCEIDKCCSPHLVLKSWKYLNFYTNLKTAKKMHCDFLLGVNNVFFLFLYLII